MSAEDLSLVAIVPLRKILVRLSLGRLKKAPISCDLLSLTYNSVFRILNPTGSEFLSLSAGRLTRPLDKG
jgi:hypothetical protein